MNSQFVDITYTDRTGRVQHVRIRTLTPTFHQRARARVCVLHMACVCVCMLLRGRWRQTAQPLTPFSPTPPDSEGGKVNNCTGLGQARTL